MSEYDEQAERFLKKTKTEFTAEYLRHGVMPFDDKTERDIYRIILKRGTREFVFEYGQSLNASGAWIFWGPKGKELLPEKRNKPGYQCERNKKFEKPSAYDVLACLQKNDPGTLENFCSEFGYVEDSRKAEKIYLAVLKEYENLKMLYNDEELEEMQEIQ